MAVPERETREGSHRGTMARLRGALAEMLGRGEDRRDPLGPAGERAAAKLLGSKGYRVIGSNLRVPMGEADVLAVAPDGETVVLVEVKSRRVDAQEGGEGALVAPPPEASITAHKREKLTAILRHLARANGWTRRPMRIDAVAIEWPAEGRGEPTIRHHEGAVAVGR